MKVLIADDEKILADTLKEVLKHHKIDADAVYDGDDAVYYALNGCYDLIILDVMMPKKNGIEVLKALRSKKFNQPILMLSAKSEIVDKIEGLDNGADDYLTKPFSSAELISRIKALTRRKGEFLGDKLVFNNLALNKNTFELECGEKKIALSAKEFKIMETLITNTGIIMQKERIVEKVWGYDNESEYNSVEVYISFLRKKIAAVGADVHIRAVRGVGYSLEGGSEK